MARSHILRDIAAQGLDPKTKFHKTSDGKLRAPAPVVSVLPPEHVIVEPVVVEPEHHKKPKQKSEKAIHEPKADLAKADLAKADLAAVDETKKDTNQ